MGFIVLKYRPFSAKMQDGRFQFLYAKSCEDGTFFLEFALFSLIKTQILSLEGMMNVLACSKRSDSGERCGVEKAMKSRGGLGREVRERL